MIEEVWGLKKIAIWVFVILGLCIFFLIYDLILKVPTFTIEDVKLTEADIFKRPDNTLEYYVFDVNENDVRRLTENNIKLKEAIVTLKYGNQSFFNTIYDVKVKYAAPEKLPPIIVGENPAIVSINQLNIYARTHKREFKKCTFKMVILIDPQNYSDTDILETLKSVDIMVIKKTQQKVNVLATLSLSK